ncbi:hypothetical protein BJY04DRAFT_202984 [Aspergillus karnatakaensis]|uniref:uncharacterized protein n=1 Tax=Aspergillus karnatakaensis TaxID=1810916 RepID=UPI003CCE1FDC
MLHEGQKPRDLLKVGENISGRRHQSWRSSSWSINPASLSNLCFVLGTFFGVDITYIVLKRMIAPFQSLLGSLCIQFRPLRRCNRASSNLSNPNIYICPARRVDKLAVSVPRPSH